MTSEEGAEPKRNRKRLNACRDFLQKYVPITMWLPKYKWKEYILSDLTAGLTMGCLQIAQGMAFAMLAKVEPIMGLYTSCFPVLIYCLLGTAPVSSFGTVSVTSLLVGETIEKESDHGFTAEQLSEVITFLVGALYLIAFFIHYHVITKIFSKYLTSAFVTACSIQVIIKSLNLLLGLHMQEFYGYFSVIYNSYYTFSALEETNLITLLISVSILFLLAINTYVIIPQMRKVTNFIIPIEIIILVTVTVMSHYLEFQRFEVDMLGSVPSGLPRFIPPKILAVPLIWVDAFIIASINFATTLSILTMFNTDVRVSQELLALGVTNLLCCNLNCIPFGNSMMRTVVAKNCGVKTLLADVVSSAIVLMAILFMGPLFSPMPQCVLGCIIVYGLTMLVIRKCKEMPDMFKGGAENATIWVLTGILTLFVSIQLGLLIGLVLTLRQFLSNPDWESDKKKEEEPPNESSQPVSGKAQVQTQSGSGKQEEQVQATGRRPKT